MKPDNRIYIFFTALALLFWNPLVLAVFYKNTPLEGQPLVAALFWGVFLLGAAAIWFLKKDRLGPRAANWVFSLSAIGIFSYLLFGLDAALPLFLPSAKQGLVFEPGSQVTLNTKEFQSVAHINSLGVRGPDFSEKKGDRFRVLCFGDSWTFGWGVNDDQSWPARLDTFLKENGHENAQVVNLGQPGTHPGVYKKHLRRAVPALKPDLVLVAVLQGDDLAQMSEDGASQAVATGGFFSKMKASVKDAARESVRYLFKNTLKLFGGKVPFNANLNEQWKTSIRDVVPTFNPLRKSRYEALPDTVRSLLQSGDLNTVLVEQYVDFPDRYLTANTPEDPRTRWAAEKMARDFEEMAAVCRANGARLVLVNVPFNVYVGHEVVRNTSDSLNTFLYNHNRIDSLHRAIAEGAGIGYIELTEGFKALTDKTAYFYKYDGHPSPRGYDEIGREVGQQLLGMPVWGK